MLMHALKELHKIIDVRMIGQTMRTLAMSRHHCYADNLARTPACHRGLHRVSEHSVNCLHAVNPEVTGH